MGAAMLAAYRHCLVTLLQQDRRLAIDELLTAGLTMPARYVLSRGALAWSVPFVALAQVIVDGSDSSELDGF